MDVAPLVAWAHQDLLTAYEALTLVLHWPEHIATQWIRGAGGDLQAVAIRWQYPAPHGDVPLRYYYAATGPAALEHALSALPPEGECLLCAPDTEAHQPLLCLPTSPMPEEVFYEYGGGPPPAPVRGVVQFSSDEAIAAGLAEPWHWPSILGKEPAERPIHCIMEDGRVIAVASAGCVTPLTEEVRGVWVESERRRRGYGRDVVAAATRGILGRGRLPIYTHRADNSPSQRLAESVGYVRRGAFLRLEHGGGGGQRPEPIEYPRKDL